MADRYEAVAIRKYQDRDGNEKTSFTNVGVAWPMKDKDGYTVRLSAMPAPTEGEFVILLMPPKPKDGQQQSRSAPAKNTRQQPNSFSRDIDDDIAF
ncbi:hypothetical protein EON76_05225 [bacterium]|nr:MAG: hypothetical protein EON76_05225 [bacterium]